MTKLDLPPGLTPSGSSRTFTETSLPKALCEEHSLRAGRWGVLHILEGRAWFVDAASGVEEHLVGPCTWTIRPQAIHRLRLDGALQCRIDFYDEAAGEPG